MQKEKNGKMKNIFQLSWNVPQVKKNKVSLLTLLSWWKGWWQLTTASNGLQIQLWSLKICSVLPPPPSSKTLPVKSKLWSGNHPLLCFTSVRSEPIVNHYIAIGVRTKLTSEFGIVDSHLCSKTRGWGGMFPIASVSCTGQYLSDFSTPKLSHSLKCRRSKLDSWFVKSLPWLCLSPDLVCNFFLQTVKMTDIPWSTYDNNWIILCRRSGPSNQDDMPSEITWFAWKNPKQWRYKWYDGMMTYLGWKG